MVLEQARAWPDTGIWVGCSGKFTIERTLAHLGRPLHSNDVHIYPCAVGGYLAGAPLALTLSASALQEFPFLEGSLGESPEQDLATLLLCSSIASAYGRQNRMFLARLVEGYRHQWPQLLERTKAKLVDAAAGVKLASFAAEDVTTWINRVPEDAPVVSYPPQHDADHYEAMFKRLNAMFDWDAPPYEFLDTEHTAGLIDRITDRDHWMLCLSEPHEEFNDQGLLRGRIRTSPRSKEIYVYASGTDRRIITVKQATEPVLIPKLGADETLRPDADVALVAFNRRQFNHLRSVYLSRSITPARSANFGTQCGVLVDGVLVGAFYLSSYGSFGWNARLTAPTIYMVSDFPVAPTAYKHLAKLVVLAATSKEAGLEAERVLNRRFRSVGTHAFTHRPVSMKYRGVLDLIDRDDRGDAGFAIAYGGPLGERTLAEAYQLWYEKYAARHDDPEPSEQPKGRRGRRNKP